KAQRSLRLLFPIMLTVAIPTFNRGKVLVETLRHLLAQEPPPDEILVLDQTPQHAEGIQKLLSTWQSAGAIRRLLLREPSVTKAMNRGLIAATCDHILFLDDDIVPEPG